MHVVWFLVIAGCGGRGVWGCGNLVGGVCKGNFSWRLLNEGDYLVGV